MASMYQVQWRWSGFVGGPGYTNLFFAAVTASPTDALAAANKSRVLFDGVKGGLMGNTTISLMSDVKVIEDSDGETLDIYSVSGVSPVTGAGSGSYAAPVGICIDWLTNTLHAGRRMQGRTFLVPVTIDALSGDGSPSSAFITTVQGAATAFQAAAGPTFGVWGRPRKADPDAVPPKPAVAGLWGPVLSSRVPDKTVVLRSRRD